MGDNIGKMGSDQCQNKLKAPMVTSNGAKCVGRNGSKEAVLGGRSSPRLNNADKRPSAALEDRGKSKVSKVRDSKDEDLANLRTSSASEDLGQIKLKAPAMTNNGDKCVGKNVLKEAVLGVRSSPRLSNAEKRHSAALEDRGKSKVSKVRDSTDEDLANLRTSSASEDLGQIKLKAPMVTNNGAKCVGKNGSKEAVLGGRSSPRLNNAEKRPSAALEDRGKSKVSKARDSTDKDLANLGISSASDDLGQSKLKAPMVTDSGAECVGKNGSKEAVLGKRSSPRLNNAEKRPSAALEDSRKSKVSKVRDSTDEDLSNLRTSSVSDDLGQSKLKDPKVTNNGGKCVGNNGSKEAVLGKRSSLRLNNAEKRPSAALEDRGKSKVSKVKDSTDEDLANLGISSASDDLGQSKLKAPMVTDSGAECVGKNGSKEAVLGGRSSPRLNNAEKRPSAALEDRLKSKVSKVIDSSDGDLANLGTNSASDDLGQSNLEAPTVTNNGAKCVGKNGSKEAVVGGRSSPRLNNAEKRPSAALEDRGKSNLSKVRDSTERDLANLGTNSASDDLGQSNLEAPTVTNNGAKCVGKNGSKEAVLGGRSSPRLNSAEKRPSAALEDRGKSNLSKVRDSTDGDLANLGTNSASDDLGQSNLEAPTVTNNGVKCVGKNGSKEAVLGGRSSPRLNSAEKRPSAALEDRGKSKVSKVRDSTDGDLANLGTNSASDDLGQSNLEAPTVTNNGAKCVGKNGSKEAVLGGRSSPRLNNAEKRPSAALEDRGNCKASKVIDSTDEDLSNVGISSAPDDLGHSSNSALNQYSLKWEDNGGSSAKPNKEILQVFRSHYLRSVQEEQRCTNGVINDTQILKGSKNNMLMNNAALYPKKRSCKLSGTGVGRQLFSQDELMAVGFRGHSWEEIDHTETLSRDMEKYKGYKFPLAFVLVLPDQYRDPDNSEEFVYITEGVNDTISRGDLALQNNKEQDVPVRIICEYECDSSFFDRVPTYEGLFKVADFWTEEGTLKYRLQRLPGQSKLVAIQAPSSNICLPKALSEIPGLVCMDISNGQEPICIPATNIYDDPPVGPAGFTYIKSVQVSDTVNFPPDAPGCSCKGSCTNKKTCSCAQLNGSDFPYVGTNGGRLIESSDVVFECGPRCNCGPNCINRTSQRGLKYQLEVYRTAKKGWAVRSWDFIPSGAPVCEYVGVLRKTDELEQASENEYIFEIDCWQTMNEIGGRERRYRDVSVSWEEASCSDRDDENMQESEYCIDAGSFGNVARFINHSCDPNLFIQCVLSSHRDIRFARLMLFAADDIPPMQELTYDYGYALDSVIGPNGEVKELACFCGAKCCRKRLY